MSDYSHLRGFWTCGICGASVLWGCTHYCSGTMPTPEPSEFQQLMAKLNQIVSLLQEMRQ